MSNIVASVPLAYSKSSQNELGDEVVRGVLTAGLVSGIATATGEGFQLAHYGFWIVRVSSLGNALAFTSMTSAAIHCGASAVMALAIARTLVGTPRYRLIAIAALLDAAFGIVIATTYMIGYARPAWRNGLPIATNLVIQFAGQVTTLTLPALVGWTAFRMSRKSPMAITNG